MGLPPGRPLLLPGILEVKGQHLSGTVHMHGDGEWKCAELVFKGIDEEKSADELVLAWCACVHQWNGLQGQLNLKYSLDVISLIKFWQPLDWSDEWEV